MNGGMTFTVSTNFGEQIRELSKVTGMPVLEVYRDEMRLLVENVAFKTPPRKGKPKSEAVSKHTPLVIQSTKTLRKDLSNVAKPARFQDVKIDRLKMAIQQGRQDVAQAILQRLPATHSWSGRTILTASQLAAAHRNLQNSRGRVPREQPHVVIDAEGYDKRLAKLASGVGIAKASWTPALDFLRGKKPPAYVLRHGKMWGSVSESTKQFDVFGGMEGAEITATGSGIKRSRSEYEAIIHEAMRFRTRQIATKVKRVVDAKIIELTRRSTMFERNHTSNAFARWR